MRGPRTSRPPECVVLELAIPLMRGPMTKCSRPGQDVPPLLSTSTTFPVTGSWVQAEVVHFYDTVSYGVSFLGKSYARR